MLKGIVNIKLKPESENSRRNYHGKFPSKYSIKHVESHDSLDISKGYRILRDYGINLKRFKRNESGILEVAFEYSSIEFTTNIDVEKLSALLELDYELNYIKPEPKFKVTLYSRTSYFDSFSNKLNIEGIQYFMSRVISLDVKGVLTLSNTRALSNILDGVYNKVLGEFGLINSILAAAAKNIFCINIKSLPQEDCENELIIIEKIMALDESTG